MTNLIVQRHGETAGNQKSIYIGQTDWDMTERGLRQAEAAAVYLDRYRLDAIYSSDLIRAVHTAEPTARRQGLPIIRTPGLREFYGGVWEERPFDELIREYGSRFTAFFDDFAHVQCVGGESSADVYERMKETLTAIAEENDGKTVLVVSHAASIRLACCLFRGVPLEECDAIPYAGNASLTRVTYHHGHWELLAYSEDDFLGNDRTYLAAP